MLLPEKIDIMSLPIFLTGAVLPSQNLIFYFYIASRAQKQHPKKAFPQGVHAAPNFFGFFLPLLKANFKSTTLQSSNATPRTTCHNVPANFSDWGRPPKSKLDFLLLHCLQSTKTTPQKAIHPGCPASGLKNCVIEPRLASCCSALR